MKHLNTNWSGVEFMDGHFVIGMIALNLAFIAILILIMRKLK